MSRISTPNASQRPDTQAANPAGQVKSLAAQAVFAALALAACVAQAAPAAPVPTNADFAQTQQDGQPTGWNIRGEGYAVRSECSSGCTLSGQSQTNEKNGGWFAVEQMLLPAGAAGHVLRISAMIRTEDLSDSAYLAAHVLSVNDSMSNQMTSTSRPAGTSAWSRYEVAVPVPKNAKKVFINMGSAGKGKAWFDKLQLQVDDSVAVPADVVFPPRPAPSQALLDDAALRLQPAEIAAVDEAWRADVRTRTHAIRSLFSDDFSDLQFLKPLLAGKRVVQLGESSHGVSEFTLTKARLIKFLHQEMGYDVLAFEGSLAQCYYADLAATTLGARELMGSCVFGSMAHQELQPLLEYLQSARKNGRRLNLAGFDTQDSAFYPAMAETRIHTLLSALSAPLAARLTQAEGDVRRAYGQFAAGPLPLKSAETLTAFYQEAAAALTAGRARLLASGITADEADLAVRHFQSRVRLVQQLSSTSMAEYGNLRDLAMADNVDYLLDKLYPGRKVIIYAHNAHIAYQPVPNNGTPMGQHLAQRRRSELYTIGLYMSRGMAAQNNGAPYPISPAKAGSMEAVLANAGLKYAFVDLTQARKEPGSAWMTRPIPMREWGTVEGRITPASTYDALIYIDTVTPSRWQ
jgi:erythromycin esterase